MEKRESFRRLRVPVSKPRRLDSFFWWSAGILLCVAFLACVAMAWYAHRMK
jgi:hypothetical protein